MKQNTSLRAVYGIHNTWYYTENVVFFSFYITFTDTPETIDGRGNNNNSVCRKNVPAWKKKTTHIPLIFKRVWKSPVPVRTNIILFFHPDPPTP